MNLADLEQHRTEVCEYRQVYCEECEKDMPFKKYSKHSCVISKDVSRNEGVIDSDTRSSQGNV